MSPSFRDRFFTPTVAGAIMSPVGILLAGAGTALGIVVGAPIAAAVGIGVAAWAVRVAVAVPRQPKAESIDPFTLSEPWRNFVQEALQQQHRFERATASTKPGPLRERLGEIEDRIQAGVRECWRIALRGHDIEKAVGQLDMRSAQQQLALLARDGIDASEQTTAVALQAQLDSYQRMRRVSKDTADRLRLLDARLGEAVARAIELSVSAGSSADASGLTSDIDDVVGEMEALRQALEETGSLSSGAGPVPGTDPRAQGGGTPLPPPTTGDQAGGSALPGPGS